MDINITLAIQAAGGVSRVSKETGIPIATLSAWKNKGFAPPWRIADVRKIVGLAL